MPHCRATWAYCWTTEPLGRNRVPKASKQSNRLRFLLATMVGWGEEAAIKVAFDGLGDAVGRERRKFGLLLLTRQRMQIGSCCRRKACVVGMIRTMEGLRGLRAWRLMLVVVHLSAAWANEWAGLELGSWQATRYGGAQLVIDNY